MTPLPKGGVWASAPRPLPQGLSDSPRSSDCGEEGLAGRRATKTYDGRGGEEVTRPRSQQLVGGRAGREGKADIEAKKMGMTLMPRKDLELGWGWGAGKRQVGLGECPLANAR